MRQTVSQYVLKSVKRHREGTGDKNQGNDFVHWMVGLERGLENCDIEAWECHLCNYLSGIGPD